MGTATTEHGSAETRPVIETTHLDALALAESGAVVAAAVMLLLGVFGTIGVYEGAVEMMEQWHLFFEPTIVGTIGGMIEAAIITFVLVYPFAWLYNVFSR